MNTELGNTNDMMNKRVVVVGAGVMGSGIAAHAANSGFKTTLIDNEDRAASAKASLLKQKPSPIVSKKTLGLITTASSGSDKAIKGIEEADIIIEAIYENLEAKLSLFKELRSLKKPSCILASNTSTFPLGLLNKGLDDDDKDKLVILHFFNPVRYMELLEVVTTEYCTVKDEINKFAMAMGKTAIACNDTPGFIANRIGTYWLQVSLNELDKAGIPVEAADAALSNSMGVPKTGAFALMDLVGLDTLPYIIGGLKATLPKEDSFQLEANVPVWLNEMINTGFTGRKGKGGFYRLNNKVKESLGRNGEYTPVGEVIPDMRSVESFAATVKSKTLEYAKGLLGEVSDSMRDIDEAMKLGYKWKKGPFEMLGELDKAEKPLDVLKVNQERLFGNTSASAWDIGDGVACLEFHTKANALDELVLAALRELTTYDLRAAVIYNEGSNFSVGANLTRLLGASPESVDRLIREGQETMLALRDAPFPIVGAPSGMALGGGCEVLLHCDAIQAHQELYAGLVEVGVGLVPAWGGSKEMVGRWGRNPFLPKGMASTAEAFKNISTAKVSTSAAEAQEMLILRHTDRVSASRSTLLNDAKRFAMELSMPDAEYKPKPFKPVKLSGKAGRLALGMAVEAAKFLGQASEYDAVISNEVATILTGGSKDILELTTEKDLLDLERESFIRLSSNTKTVDRVTHTLRTNRPLRN